MTITLLIVHFRLSQDSVTQSAQSRYISKLQLVLEHSSHLFQRKAIH